MGETPTDIGTVAKGGGVCGTVNYTSKPQYRKTPYNGVILRWVTLKITLGNAV